MLLLLFWRACPSSRICFSACKSALRQIKLRCPGLRPVLRFLISQGWGFWIVEADSRQVLKKDNYSVSLMTLLSWTPLRLCVCKAHYIRFLSCHNQACNVMHCSICMAVHCTDQVITMVTSHSTMQSSFKQSSFNCYYPDPAVYMPQIGTTGVQI